MQVLCLDAGHLKGGWKGVVYVLSAKDCNNRIIHVATVLADKENETNYRFLLEQTCKNEQMERLIKSNKTTFFIDGHRGSPPALAAVCPEARVRTCLRHLLTNKTMHKMGAVSSESFCARAAPKQIRSRHEGDPAPCFGVDVFRRPLACLHRSPPRAKGLKPTLKSRLRRRPPLAVEDLTSRFLVPTVNACFVQIPFAIFTRASVELRLYYLHSACIVCNPCLACYFFLATQAESLEHGLQGREDALR